MSDSDFQLSAKTIQKSESSISFVEKPPTVKGICSVETGLPVIIEPKKPRTKNVCSFEPAKSSLKKNVTLPKLKQNKVHKYFEAGEPCGKFHSVSSARLSESVVNSEDTFVLRSCDRDSSDIGENPQKQLELCISEGRLEELMKKIDEEELEENKALKRWEFWMKDKNRIQTHLSKKIGRHPYNLMLQESDKYRKVMEKKLLHTYPVSTLDKFEDCSVDPRKKNKKEIKRKKEVKSEKPVIEYIRIPNGIKVEKGLHQLHTEIQDAKIPLSFGKKKFFNDRMPSSTTEDEKEDLMVVGKQIFEEKEQTESSVSSNRLPEIITPSSEEEESLTNSVEDRSSVFCLVIDGEEIKYQVGAETCQNSEKSFTWALDFGVWNARSTAEKTLRFENRGTMAVKYDWFSDVEQQKSLGVLQLKKREPWFFFNKNSGFFLPGQIYEFKFYLHAKSSGIRKETWYLKTNPPLSKNQEFGAINMSAVATEEISESREPLEWYLRRRVRDSTVFFIINVLLQKVFRNTANLRGVEYRSIFTEKELFECHNPKHYYHPSIVKELYKIFKQIPNKSQAEWDMSLDSLFCLAKKLPRETKKERNAFLMEISHLAKRLLRPNFSPVGSSKKYKMTYGILCKAVNSMEEDYDYLRSLVSEKQEHFTVILKEEDSSEMSEEFGEFEPFLPMVVIKSINLVFFQTLFYIKVYHRICEAVESIVGMLETAKLLEPWKQINYKQKKPAKCQNSEYSYSK